MFEDTSIFSQLLLERLNYFIYVVLLLIGLWAMIAKNNLIKKLIGMSIFQTAIILFYVSIGVKEKATIPIYLPEHDPHGSHLKIDINGSEQILKPEVLEASLVSGYTNPLPHVLMLTAIVVGVATLGLALSVCLRIYRGYGTAEEDELMEKLEREDADNVGGPHRRKPRRRRSLKKPASVTESKKSFTEKKHTAEKPKTRRRRSSTRKTRTGELESGSDKMKKPSRKPRKPSVGKPKEDNSQ
jgi:multicomponent Na+:H+ antiporter subunit C